MRIFTLCFSVCVVTISQELYAAAFDIDVTDLLNQNSRRNLDKSDETSGGSLRGFDIEAVFDKYENQGKVQNKKGKHHEQYQIEDINNLPLSKLLTKLDESLEEISPQNLLGIQDLLLKSPSSVHHRNSGKGHHRHESHGEKATLDSLQKLVSQSLSSYHHRNSDKKDRHSNHVKAQNLNPIADLLDRDQKAHQDSLVDLQKLVSQSLSSLHHLNSKNSGYNRHNSKHQEQLQHQNVHSLIDILNKDEKSSQDLLGSLQNLLSQPLSNPHSISDRSSQHKHKKHVQPNNLLGRNPNSFDLNDYSKIFVVLNPEAIKDMRSFNLDRLNELLTLTEKGDQSHSRRLGGSGERYSDEYRPKRQQRSRYERGGGGGGGAGRTAIPYVGKSRGEIYEKDN